MTAAAARLVVGAAFLSSAAHAAVAQTGRRSMPEEEAMFVVAWVFLGALGLVVGSFLNVCIYRLPLDLSVVSPRSRCPGCETQIAALHNVPVLSWVALGGKCASCGMRISVRYPGVEVLNALVWVALAVQFGLTVQTWILLPFASAMIVLFFTDWDHKLLPDKITLTLPVAGLAMAPWNGRLDFGFGLLADGTVAGRLVSALAGAALGYGIFALLVLIWQLLFKREAMGGGDLKMMLGVGAFLGMHGVVVTIFAASLVGTLISIPLLFARGGSMRSELPFGCFLAPAALVTAFYGIELVRWYTGMLWLPGS